MTSIQNPEESYQDSSPISSPGALSKLIASGSNAPTFKSITNKLSISYLSHDYSLILTSNSDKLDKTANKEFSSKESQRKMPPITKKLWSSS